MGSATPRETVLQFSGTQTIAKVEDARQRLLDGLAQPGTDLHIDCHAVDGCDLAFLQVLMAAQRSATARGTSLKLVGSAAVSAACAAAGIDLTELTGTKGN